MTATFETVFACRAEKWEGETKGTLGAGLALSGGGFRAMLFHAGSIKRLHELGALIPLSRISSVSGGSIAAAVLARGWPHHSTPGAPAGAFKKHFEEPVWDIADRRIDVAAVLSGLATPWASVADKVAKRYSAFLDNADKAPPFCLSGLPDSPRFTFCATNLASGSLMRFAKPYSADYRVGKRDGLDLPMSQVVAASSAFPPFLSPMKIDLSEQPLNEHFGQPAELAGQGFDTKLELSDGGVYDNLGLQPLAQYHTILVSDGGGPFSTQQKSQRNWVGHMVRNWTVTDRQVRSLRNSGLVRDFQARRRRGVYWGISTPYNHYPERLLKVHDSWPNYLSQVPTRLHRVNEQLRCELINLGYAMTDAAVRSYVVPEKYRETLPEPRWPYPDANLGGPAPEKFGVSFVRKVW